MLLIAATPIGNLGDLGARARQAFMEADIIACEDTRHTGRMLALLGIATPARRIAYHDHSSKAVREKLLTAMREQSAKVMLVSDAGTPLISDPGYRLVQACHEQGIAVSAIPGPSALLAGLVVSGFPTADFFYGGFVKTPKAARREQIESALGMGCVAVFFESPRRLAATLGVIAAAAPERKIAIAREMTKIHEEIIRGKAGEVAAILAARDSAPKGEIVLVIDGGDKAAPAPAAHTATAETMLRHAEAAGMSRRDAVRMASTTLGLSRKEVYALANKNK